MTIEAIKQALQYIEANAETKDELEIAEGLRQIIAKIEKRNFCSRCGKKLGKNDWDIHTCTSPDGVDE
jgi:NADH pyrophosphatase NudC (nudix superfamily)